MSKPSRRQLLGFLSALAGVPILGRLPKAQPVEEKPKSALPSRSLCDVRLESISTFTYDCTGRLTSSETPCLITYYDSLGRQTSTKRKERRSTYDYGSS